MDHLYAEKFTDDLLHAHIAVTYKGEVMVTLHPHVYGCPSCEAKGFVPRLVDAFKQRIRPTWCTDCLEATDLRRQRQEELTPRLKSALERAFTVREVSPDSPFTSYVISP